MFGTKAAFEAVIEAQAKHIKRLERQVDTLFNALLWTTKDKNAIPQIDIGEPAKVMNLDGEAEPDPGELFSTEELTKGMP